MCALGCQAPIARAAKHLTVSSKKWTGIAKHGYSSLLSQRPRRLTLTVALVQQDEPVDSDSLVSVSMPLMPLKSG